MLNSSTLFSLPLLLLNLNIKFLDEIDNPAGFSNFQLPGKSYDFILVGSGPAGSVMAARLAESSPNISVLLLEAGGDGTHITNYPAGILYSMNEQAVSKYFLGEPESSCCQGSVGKRCKTFTGKVLGGGSVVNGMAWVWGKPEDYDYWESLGSPGFSFKDFHPYLKKTETVLEDSLAGPHRGDKGPVSVKFSRTVSRSSKSVMKGLEELGYVSADYNQHNGPCFGKTQLTQRDVRRDSAATAYLTPNLSKRNMVVSLNSYVTKILINKKKEAYGVEFHRNGKKYSVYAKKEVILSSGVFSSPKLLMLSGIGPAEELKKHGIPVIEDRPVGDNLANHVGVMGLIYFSKQSITFRWDDIHNPINLVLNLAKKVTGQESPLSSSFIDVKWFFTTPMNKPPFKTDVEVEFIPYNVLAHEYSTTQKLLGITTKNLDVYKPLFNRYSFLVKPYVSQPKSRGRILLRSGDPFDDPIIHCNWFDHPDDVRQTILAIREAQKLESTAAFQKLGVTLFRQPVHDCKDFVFDTDAYWECHIKSMSWTAWHELGTCKMGLKNDPTSVVGSNFKVHGVSRLRVVDASVIPTMITGNIQATVYALAEKAADLIKEEWKLL